MANRAKYLNDLDLARSLGQMLHLQEMGRSSYTKNKIADGNLVKMSFLLDCLSILLEDCYIS